MQINNNVNFTGIYKLPYNSANLKEVTSFVLPMYQTMKKEPWVCFSGRNPLSPFINDALETIAELAGGSKEWLKLNAENFNISTDIFKNFSIYAITSKADVQSYERKYSFSTDKIYNRLEKGLKREFSKKLLFNNSNMELPFHIKCLKYIINEDKKIMNKFEKFMAKKVQDFEEPQELFWHLMCNK